jgi:hypothetical protein
MDTAAGIDEYRRLQGRSMYRLRHIQLSTGNSLNPGQLTVAVGPNNGGKSRFLKDLVSSIAYTTRLMVSLQKVEPDFPHGPGFVIDKIAKNAATDESGNLILDAPSPDLGEPLQLRLSPGALGIGAGDKFTDEQRKKVIRDQFGRHLVCHLTTERRLLLLKRQVNRQPHVEGQQTPLEAAFARPDLIEAINTHVKGAFDTQIVLDDSLFAAVEFRLGDPSRFSSDLQTRRKEIQALPQLDEQGDGIRSFCGLLVAIATLERPVVMIDEPEAFLHPPQAFLAGRAIAELCKDVQFFVATHSSEVLRGILSVTSDATIVRFSRSKDVFLTKVLNPADLKTIYSDPVLSSVRVLDGLFYSGVAVTESDGDVVVYRSVLGQMDSSDSIGFVNSYDKRASAKIAVPFRAMGVPCAVVVDFDILRVRDELRAVIEALGGNWNAIKPDYDHLIDHIEGVGDADARLIAATTLLDEVRMNLAAQGETPRQLEWLRRRLKDVREKASVWDELKRTGVDGLSSTAKPYFYAINSECTRLGIFVAGAGEREAWLTPQVAFTPNKRHWTELALTYLSTSPLPETHRLRKYVEAIWQYCSKGPS